MVWYSQVADITFNFWNRLSELLYEEMKEKKSDAEDKQLDASKSNRLLPFKPYIARLIIALCRLCQYDPHTVLTARLLFIVIGSDCTLCWLRGTAVERLSSVGTLPVFDG